jgi:hypothetical protein
MKNRFDGNLLGNGRGDSWRSGGVRIGCFGHQSWEHARRKETVTKGGACCGYTSGDWNESQTAIDADVF